MMHQFCRINNKSHKYISSTTLCFQPNIPYYIFLRTTNRAGSSIVTVSKSLMLDLLSPIPGNVVDGTELMHDIKFQSSLTDVKGTNALELDTLAHNIIILDQAFKPCNMFCIAPYLMFNS